MCLWLCISPSIDVAVRNYKTYQSSDSMAQYISHKNSNNKALHDTQIKHTDLFHRNNVLKAIGFFSGSYSKPIFVEKTGRIT